MSQRIIITGATGFIGNALCKELIGGGYEVFGLSRNREMGKKLLPDEVEVVKWDTKSGQGWADYADGAYAIVNLAGENIAAGGWTEEKKERIIQSRLDAGKAVLEAVEKAKNRPSVIIQASGIGYYGDSGDEILDETSSPGAGFLVEVAKQWEKTTEKVESFGVRQVIIRTGVVLGEKGGFLSRILLPYRFFVGGHMGSGKQWISWIHIDDEVRAIRFLMEKKDLQGVFNLSSPHPLTSRDFSRILGKVMKKPAWLPVPGFMLRLFLGEMATELILSGQRALPERLQQSGFQFQYPDLESALSKILSQD